MSRRVALVAALLVASVVTAVLVTGPGGSDAGRAGVGPRVRTADEPPLAAPPAVAPRAPSPEPAPLAPAHSSAAPPAAPDEPLATLAAAEPPALSGTVLDATGAPRPGVELVLSRPATPAERLRERAAIARWSRRPDPADVGWTRVDTARTNAGGRFQFPSAPPGELRVVGAFQPSPTEVQVVAAALTLTPGEQRDLGALPLGRQLAPATLRIELTLDGRPAGSDDVWRGDEPLRFFARLADVGEWPTVPLAGPHPPDTDVRVFGLPAATWQLQWGGQLDAGGLVPLRMPPMHPLDGRLVTLPGDDLRVSIPFSTWIAVRITLVDQRAASAPPPLELQVFDAGLGWVQGPTPLSRDDARPDFYAAPGEYVVLAVDAQPHRFGGDPARGLARVSVVPPGPARAELVVSEGTSVRGTLRDADGAPLAGARLELWPAGSPIDLPTKATLASATSDARGAFELSGVPARANVELRAHVGEQRWRRVGAAFTTGPPGAPTLVDLEWPRD